MYENKYYNNFYYLIFFQIFSTRLKSYFKLNQLKHKNIWYHLYRQKMKKLFFYEISMQHLYQKCF